MTNGNVPLFFPIEGGDKKMKYSVHRFDIDMTKDQNRLEKFLNELEGEVVSIFPNIRPKFLGMGATAVLDCGEGGQRRKLIFSKFPKKNLFYFKRNKEGDKRVLTALILLLLRTC